MNRRSYFTLFPFSLSLVVVLAASCSQSPETSDFKAGKDALSFDDLGSGYFRVNCVDDVSEIRSQNEITLNRVCLPDQYLLRTKAATFYVSENGESDNCLLPAGTKLRLNNSEIPRYANERHLRVQLAIEADLPTTCNLREGLVLANAVELGRSDGKTSTWGIQPLALGESVSSDVPSTFAVQWTSDEGEYIGRGETRIFTPANAVLKIQRESDNSIGLSVEGSASYSLDFKAAKGEKLEARAYENATRYPFSDEGNGIDISGNGSGCNQITGRFEIKEIVFDEQKKLEKLDLQFEQHCEGGPKALRGRVVYIKHPDNNEIRLNGHSGDFISKGQESVFKTDVDKFIIRKIGSDKGLTFSIDAKPKEGSSWGDHYSFEFASDSISPFEERIYLGATRYPFNGPTEPGLDVSGGGSGCNKLNGSFRVFRYKETETHLTFYADYIQHCDNKAVASWGSVRYDGPK